MKLKVLWLEEIKLPFTHKKNFYFCLAKLKPVILSKAHKRKILKSQKEAELFTKGVLSNTVNEPGR